MNETANASRKIPCTDEVLLAIWRIKDSLSAVRGHGLNKLFADARESQKHCGHRVVDLSDIQKATTHRPAEETKN